jgi:hypothetical protein
MAEAFQKQARCDFEWLRKIWPDDKINQCHKAHILQMCLEKYSKFHLLSQGQTITNDHKCVAKVLPRLFQERYENNYPSQKQFRIVFGKYRDFCNKVDELTPSLSKPNPTNCEYPWETTDIHNENPRSHAPCSTTFPVVSDPSLEPIYRKILAMIDQDTRP